MKRNNENNSTLLSGEAIGRRLASVLTSRRTNEAEIAGELGISEEDVKQYEKGCGQLSFNSIRQIANYLGTSVAYLTCQSAVDLPARYAQAYPF